MLAHIERGFHVDSSSFRSCWKPQGRKRKHKESPMSKVTGTVWGLSAGKKNEAETKFYTELGEHGGRVMTQVADNTIFRQQLVQFGICGGFQPSTDQRIAQLLMGEQNFFGPKEWLTRYGKFGVSFTKQQLKRAAEFPWGEDILNSPDHWEPVKLVKDTHFAYLGVDTVSTTEGKRLLSINRLQGWFPATGQPRFYSYDDDCWYGNGKQGEQPFAKIATCSLRWYLLRKEIVSKSTDTPYDQQLAMLPPEYEPPLAVEEVTKHILFGALNLGAYLNKSVYARCRDLSARGRRLNIDNSGSGGLDVYDWDDSGRCGIGVGASRKLPK